MKILNVIGQMGYGGAELLILDIAKGLSDRGIETSIAVVGDCDPEIIELIKGWKIEFHQFDLNLLSPWNIIRIVKLVRQGQFDIVHAHLFPCIYWVAFSSLFFGKPVCLCYTEHSTSNRRRDKLLFRFLEAWAYRRYTKIVCVSVGVQNSLLSFLNELKATVVENGVHIERFDRAEASPRDEFGFDDDDIIICMVGAFRVEKNQSRLVASLKFLPEHYKLVLVGDGPEFQVVKHLAKVLGVDDRVRFLGVRQNVENLLKMADIYVLASLFEGFGLSAMEAAAAGLPVVYSQVLGLGELFEGAGIPVHPEKVQSISEGILLISKTKESMAIYSSKSKELANQYSFEEMLGKYYALYSELTC